MKYLLILLFSLFVGCGTTSVKPRSEAVPTTFSINVQNKGLLGFSMDKNTTSQIRDQLIENRMGIPIREGDPAQLHIEVEITGTNLSNATEFNWRLVDVRAGTIIASKSESSLLGDSGAGVARKVLAGINHLDLASYATDQKNTLPRLIEQPKTIAFPKSQTDGSQDYAIIIGIEKYRNEITPALHASNDAKAMKNLFEKTLNIPAQNIKTLINERASKTDIMGAIFEWLPKNAQNPDARVFVFFSGHGAPNSETGNAYLLPYDADPAYLKTGGILVADIQKSLAKLKSKNAYLFLDSCFSGSGPRSVLAKGTRPLVPVNDVKSEGAITLSASGANETTGTHDSAANGLFTHHLISALIGKGDANSDSSISLKEIEAYVAQKVSVDARQQNRDQSPSVRIPKGIDSANLVLVRSLGQ